MEAVDDRVAPVESGGLCGSDGFVVRASPMTELGVTRLSARSVVGAYGRGAGISPHLGRFKGGMAAVALSGRVTNGQRLRSDLFDRGAVLSSGSDAELLLHLCAASTQRTVVNRLVDALFRVEGGFSVVFQTEELLGAVRDPRGLRPLVYGRCDGATVFASEDGAILAIGGEVVREVEPGELILVDATGARSVAPFPRKTRAACAQELLAVASNASSSAGASVWAVRDALGAKLAEVEPIEGLDVVCAPAEASAYAASFARAAVSVAVDGLHATSEGWIAVPGAVGDRVVALVLPSLTTGVTARLAVQALRSAGARRVHVRLASAPVRAPCAYGVAGPTQDELLADTSPAALAAFLGADDVAMLPVASLRTAHPRLRPGLCDGCLTRDWPLAPEEVDSQLPLFHAAR